MNQNYICTTSLTEDTLSAAVADFYRRIHPRRGRLFEYYRGQQPVPKGESVRGRPNNLLHVPFPRYITEVHTGYFLGIPPVLSFQDAKGEQLLSSAFPKLGNLLFDVGRDLSICGAGYLLTWPEQSGLKCCRCDPLSCFTIQNALAGKRAIATVRLYQSAQGRISGVLYQPEQITPFVWDGDRVHLGAAEENPLHTLSLVPFSNNPEQTGDFEMVTGLVDAYNLLLSGAMDDMQSVANAFLALYGMQGTTQSDIDNANRTRVLSLAEGGRAEFVVKNLNHEALAQLETNLRRSILQLSMTPDLSDDSFAGNTSGVALQYKLWGIEQVRAVKERSFSAALQQLLEGFSAGFSLLGSTVDLTAGHTVFYKNLPQDHAALAETLLSLSPILSQRTILEHLPWVSSAEEELLRKAAETASNSKKED